MKKVIASIVTVAMFAGCASMGPVAGLESGNLVRFDCEGHDFSARIADDYSSVRVRTHEGSVNLDRGENGEFAGDGWALKTQGGMQLMHKNKVVAKDCKKQA